MQSVEDIWTCKRCGWTYPNHHPSAKHRRSHKKVCGKVPGYIIDDRHHGHGNGGSSDEASSGDENSNHHVAEVSSAAPAVTPALAVESQSRSFDPSSLVQKPEPEAATAVEESAVTGSLEVLKEDAPKAESAKSEGSLNPVAGSAVPHPEEDIWICRACGWTYPNAHPSAKHRRNHKKHCPGKAGPLVHAPEGSSDDDSDGGLHAPKETTEKANVAASPPVVAEPQAQAAESVPTPIITSTRDFSLESVVPKEAVPGVGPDASKDGNSTPVVPSTTTAPAPVVEAPTAPVPSDAPVVAPKDSKSATPHPEGDIWKCPRCDWTYPNAHPSAKHRRNHKKHCAGVAAPKGGSSDDDSDHETHKPVAATPPTEAVASVSRDFQLLTGEVKDEASNTTPPAPKVEEPKIEEAPAQPAQPQELEVAAIDKSPPVVSTPAPKDSSAVPHAEDPNDIWICKACGWTYPNAHPSAKHRRNHKKHCPGKAAAVGPAPGGSSDDDSDGASSHKGQTCAAASETAPVVAPPVVKERAIPDLDVQQPNTTAKAEPPKVEIIERAPLAQLVSDEQTREQEAKSKEELKPSVGTADPQAPHDPNDIWVCKQCGWTYPNRHPSAKHRRNHKKVCKKTNSTGGGSSSDASSDDEHLGHFGKKKCFPCL